MRARVVLSPRVAEALRLIAKLPREVREKIERTAPLYNKADRIKRAKP